LLLLLLLLFREAFSIPNAHNSQPIRDVDVNPYNAYYFVTGGDDCNIKFWDIRNCKQPVVQQSNHSHWYLYEFDSLQIKKYNFMFSIVTLLLKGLVC
jgi:WD40 repeat protein